MRMFGKVDVELIQYLDLVYLGFYNNDIGKVKQENPPLTISWIDENFG